MAKNSFSRVLGHVLLLVLTCLLLGWIIEQTAWVLVVGLGCYLAWTLRQMSRFYDWLSTHPNEPPPEAKGVWGEIFDSIYHLQRRDSKMRSRLQAVIDRIQSSTSALRDAVVMIDSEGHLEWWNHAAERLLGLRTPDDSGQHVANLIRDPRFIEYFEQGDFRDPLEIPAPTDMNVQLQYAVTRYGPGDRLMVVRDVTRLHNLEQMRKDFVANVSHELRTPLTVVVGYLETLLDAEDDLNPRWKRPLQQMQQQANRMQALLQDLLLLARLETSDNPGEDELVDTRPLLEQIRKDAEALAGERGHRVSLEVEGNTRMHGIEGELRSAFSNLAFNAVKYTPDQGEIKLRWWSDEKGQHLSVTDNGVGIAPQHLSRLTERFYRVDTSRNSTTGGTGLGLAIVKHVLLRHQGRLEITSVPERGSTFSCHFPPSRSA